MSFQLRAPEPPAVFKAADFAGEVVLVIIGGFHEGIPTDRFGIRPGERVTIVMLTGRAAGKIFEDVVLFGQKLSSQFADMPGGDISLARINKNGQSVEFAPGSNYDTKTANDWLAQNGPRVERLCRDAVANFHEAERQIANNGGQTNRQPEAQYAPPAANPATAIPPPTETRLPGEQMLPGMPDDPAPSTLQSLRNPVSPADPDETGY